MSKNIKPRKFYRDIAEVVREARRIMQEDNWNDLPSYKILRESRHYARLLALVNKYTTLSKFRRILNGKKANTKRVKRNWKNFDYTAKRMRGIIKMHKLADIPSRDWLLQRGYADIVSAIQDYWGGYNNFRRKFGSIEIRVENGVWKNLDYGIERAIKVMQENHLETLPNAAILKKLDSSLVGAISNYYGGFLAFRELLNERMGVQSKKNKLEDMLDVYVGGEDEE